MPKTLLLRRYQLSRFNHLLPICPYSLYHSFGHCPCSSSWQIVPNYYIRLREVSLLLMAIFKFRLFLLPLGYCPSFSAIGLCFVNTTHSHDNGHSLTSSIAIPRLNYKVPCPLGGWYVYFNAQSYCQ